VAENDASNTRGAGKSLMVMSAMPGFG